MKRFIKNIFLNKTEKKVQMVSEMINNYFQNRVENIELYGKVLTNPESFEIRFIAYNYFSVSFTYEIEFGCSILYGDSHLWLQNSQHNWETADFDIFFQELQQELELRIPDKFLESRGWL